MRRPGRHMLLGAAAGLAFLFYGVPSRAAMVPTFFVEGGQAKPWEEIFESIGVRSARAASASIVVAGSEATAETIASAGNKILILQGDSAAARQLGFVPKTETAPVRRVIDTHAPDVQIVWSDPVTLPLFSVPAAFTVYAYERWKHAPLIAGRHTDAGGILWLATDPGPTGIERFPYLAQALADIGLVAPVRAANLWAFYDSSYRARADTEYLARRWRRAGVSVLFAAAWHNMEPDAPADAPLKQLIEACHRNGILVYAWLELPHVSDSFWLQHPEWREKTALGEDAQLDWRKLINLQNADAKRAVAQEIRLLLRRFDWDGVNLAELYFESLEGAGNPARFTPMNDDVRREFQQIAGFDPKDLFSAASPHAASSHPDDLRRFLDYRVRLVSRMQSEWLYVADELRSLKPWLEVILTHIDDQLDRNMRDALGADSFRSVPFLQAQKATVLVEDPATLWHLGAKRYEKLAEKWQTLPIGKTRIAVDINVVERYQDVYPTKKQTGIELFKLVHQAAKCFDHVAIYSENQIERQDLGLLAVSAAAKAIATETAPDEVTVTSPEPVRLEWHGAADVDGKPWPLRSTSELLLPAGSHRVSTGVAKPPLMISDFNGSVSGVATDGNSVEISYKSATRSILRLGSPASAVEVDGTPWWKADHPGATNSILLPRGEHIVVILP